MAINQLKAGAILSYVSIGLSNVIALLYTPFMLRMMGQSEYGLYSLVASVIAYLTILDLGFGSAIVRYTAKFRAENKVKEQYEMFGMFFILYSFIGLVTIIIGLGLYYNVDTLFDISMTTDELGKIKIMMLLMVFNLAFTFPMSVWGAIISAYENFIFQRLINIVRIILNPLIMIILLLIGYRAIGMVVITTLFNVITLLINWWYCRNRLHIHVYFGKFNWTFLREISTFSFWIFLGAIMDRIYWSTGQFVLGIYAGAASVAVYAVAIQFQGIYMGFSTAISGVFLPKITAMSAKENGDQYISDLFIRMGRLQYIILMFILGGFILFGRQFIILWAGSDYEEAYWISLLFLIPLTVPLIQNLGIIVLQARNKMKFRSVLYVIISLCSLGISIPLARQYGGIGCAIGTATALVIGQIIIMNIYYSKRVGLDIITFWKEIAKMTLAPALLVIFSMYVIHDIVFNSPGILIIYILVFSIIYLFLLWFIIMNSYERNLFINPIKKIYFRLR